MKRIVSIFVLILTCWLAKAQNEHTFNNNTYNNVINLNTFSIGGFTIGGGSNWAVNGSGKLTYSSAYNAFSNYLSLNSIAGFDSIMSHHFWHMAVRVKQTAAPSSTSYKFGFGTQSAQGFGPASAVITMSMLNDATRGQMFFYSTVSGGTLLATDPNITSYTQSTDSLLITMDRKEDLFVFTAQNVATKGPVDTFTYQMPVSTTVPLPNVGSWALYGFGASVEVDSIAVYATDPVTSDVCFAVPSTLEGFGASTYQNSLPNLFKHRFEKVYDNGAGSFRSIDFLHMVNSIIAYHPRAVYASSLENDTISGGHPDTTSYKAAVNALIAAGITVYNISPTYETPIDMTSIYLWLKSTYPNTLVDIFTPSKGRTDYLIADGRHLNDRGLAMTFEQMKLYNFTPGVMSNHAYLENGYSTPQRADLWSEGTMRWDGTVTLGADAQSVYSLHIREAPGLFEHHYAFNNILYTSYSDSTNVTNTKDAGYFANSFQWGVPLSINPRMWLTSTGGFKIGSLSGLPVNVGACFAVNVVDSLNNSVLGRQSIGQMGTDSAWNNIASGTTTRASIIFNLTGAALLTTPRPGALEAVADTLWYTLSGGSRVKLYPQSGGGGGVTTVGTFSGSAQTNGASIAGTTITFGPANQSTPGMMSTGNQSFAGSKSFAGITKVLNEQDSATTLTTGVLGVGAGSGSGGTFTQSGGNRGGTISITTGTVTTTTQSIWGASYNNSVSFPNGSSVVLYPANANAAGLAGTSAVWVSCANNGFVIEPGTVALVPSTNYVWSYQVIGY